MTETETAIGIVGVGRLGRALACALAETRELRVVLYSRHPISLDGGGRDSRWEIASDPLDVLLRCRLTLLTVADDQILPLSRQLAGRSPTPRGLDAKVVAHCAGALGKEVLAPLEEAGAAVGVFHPLASFPDGSPKPLAGAYASVEGGPSARRALGDLARQLGCIPFEVELGDRALYHAAAVLAGVLPALLLRLAEHIALAAGGGPASSPALRQLFSTTASNINRLGPLAAVSGPTARGDSATVASNLAALNRLDPRFEAVYAAVLAASEQINRAGGGNV